MKTILFLTLCIVVVTEGSDDGDYVADRSSLRLYRRCYSDSDCYPTHCCIQHHPKKEGFCLPLAREGEGCSEFHMCARTDSDSYCPCRGSLACERNPDDSFPHHTCQVKKT